MSLALWLATLRHLPHTIAQALPLGALQLLNQQLLPSQRQRLQAHNGKYLCLHWGEREVLWLGISPEGNFVPTAAMPQAHVSLRIDPTVAQHINTFIAHPQRLDYLQQFVHIQGEAALAKVVADLATQMQLNTFTPLAQCLGPTTAAAIQYHSQQCLQSLRHWLSQDGHVLAQQPALHTLNQAQQSLAMRIHALEQRLRNHGVRL